ncbi:MAG: hypothetical protein J0H42_25575 [Rhizobiales bacterium]|nr:hypothetical protein [Hyphomicrobiales bacterium]
MKYSVDFLPSGDVHMSLDADVTTAVGLKIFELLTADEAMRPSARRKAAAKRTSKTPV